MADNKITTNQELQNKLTALSALSNRIQWMSQLGQQYDGDRDLYEALGYPTRITYSDYSSRFRRQDIAKAIINRPIAKTWKGPLAVTESETEKDTAFEKGFKTLEQDLKLKNKFVRLDKLVSIGKYGVLLLGFDDVQTSSQWSTPVKGNKLLYVKPLGEGSAKIKTYTTSPNDVRYGLPEYYDIQVTLPGKETSTTLRVHHSRTIHVTAELLESEHEGVPVLEAVWNRLMDLEKLMGGSAEMFWRGARPGHQAVVDKDFQMSEGAEENLEAQINEYEHKLRRILMVEGVELKELGTQVSDPDSHVGVQIQMISAITGIPKRILTGSERGELSSAQDKGEWLEQIQERREEYADPMIIRPFVEMCIERGVLPKPTTGEWNVEWLDLFAPSEKERSEVGKIRAIALKEYMNNPETSAVVTPAAFMEYFLGLDQNQITQIMEMMEAEMVFERNNPPAEPGEGEE